jgi:hypothetical protein
MLFIQARGTVGFIFNEINKWIFMQFSVMNLNGFDFNIVSIYSRVPDERFLRICLNGITHTCMIHRWNEENKPHRNKDVVAMYCGHVFFKLRSKVKI